MLQYYTIQELIDQVRCLPVHQDKQFPKSTVNKKDILHHKSILADRDGQLADYRICLSDGSGLHIKEYENYYKIHWDHYDMATNPLMHLIYDAPHHIFTISEIILSIIACYALTKA